jgi:peptidoglycan/xylan/chitin deacetylase (PgdA/CDA1 family)
MRSRLKSAIEWMIVESGIAAVRRRAMRGRTLIVAYHNVVPDGENIRGDLSLHLPQRAFAAQLELLSELGQVVPLSSIGQEPLSDRPRFVITFDDAYAGVLSAAVAELRRRHMPATIFVAPGLFGLTPWWDSIADGETGLTPKDEREFAMVRLAGRRDDVLTWARSEPSRIRTTTNAPRVGTIDELKTALEYDALSLGSHSWSHANLAALRGAELELELKKPAEWLARTFADRYTPWLAYPYGEATVETERAAAAAGYLGGLRVDGGWLSHDPLQTPFAVPRFNVSRGLSKRGFILRLSGMIPR